MIDPAPRRISTVNSREYQLSFLCRVHQLLQLGYLRLVPCNLATEEETSITGELVRCMDEIIDDPGSAAWVRLFHVHDDNHVNSPGRKGKHRKRVDIEIVSAETCPRTRFSFEAKRLSPRHPARDYLGADGLGCFLNSDYAAKDAHGGMLGYLQGGTIEDWAKKLEVGVGRSRVQLGLVAHGDWASHAFPRGPQHCFKTTHHRASQGNTIEMFHTLLQCY